jgi:hypothetical protein
LVGVCAHGAIQYHGFYAFTLLLLPGSTNVTPLQVAKMIGGQEHFVLRNAGNFEIAAEASDKTIMKFTSHEEAPEQNAAEIAAQERRVKVRCAYFDRDLHPRMALVPIPARLKPAHLKRAGAGFKRAGV